MHLKFEYIYISISAGNYYVLHNCLRILCRLQCNETKHRVPISSTL